MVPEESRSLVVSYYASLKQKSCYMNWSIIVSFEKSEKNLSCKQVADHLELTAMMQWIHHEYDKALSTCVHIFQRTISKLSCHFLSTSFKNLQPTHKAKVAGKKKIP